MLVNLEVFVLSWIWRLENFWRSWLWFWDFWFFVRVIFWRLDLVFCNWSFILVFLWCILLKWDLILVSFVMVFLWLCRREWCDFFWLLKMLRSFLWDFVWILWSDSFLDWIFFFNVEIFLFELLSILWSWLLIFLSFWICFVEGLLLKVFGIGVFWFIWFCRWWFCIWVSCSWFWSFLFFVFKFMCLLWVIVFIVLFDCVELKWFGFRCFFVGVEVLEYWWVWNFVDFFWVGELLKGVLLRWIFFNFGWFGDLWCIVCILVSCVLVLDFVVDWILRFCCSFLILWIRL